MNGAGCPVCVRRDDTLCRACLPVRPASHHATSGTEAARARQKTEAPFKVCLSRPAHARHTETRRQKARKRAAACTAAALGLS